MKNWIEKNNVFNYNNWKPNYSNPTSTPRTQKLWKNNYYELIFSCKSRSPYIEFGILNQIGLGDILWLSSSIFTILEIDSAKAY